MRILNIGSSHPTIKELKMLKKHPIMEYAVIEDLATFNFLVEDKQDLEVFVYCPSLIHSDEASKVVEYYSKHSKEVYTISKQVFDAIAEKENAVGIIGKIKQNYLDVSKINCEDYPFVVVTDKIENPGNLGTILRTCDGVKASLLICVDPISKFSSPKVLVSSRGMALFVNKVVMTYEEAQKFLLDNNYDIYLGEPELGKSYREYDYKNKIALVIGNERYGINPKWYDNPHKKVFIPMEGKMGCLNVSIAGAILIYEAYSKRNNK